MNKKLAENIAYQQNQSPFPIEYLSYEENME